MCWAKKQQKYQQYQPLKIQKIIHPWHIIFIPPDLQGSPKKDTPKKRWHLSPVEQRPGPVHELDGRSPTQATRKVNSTVGTGTRRRKGPLHFVLRIRLKARRRMCWFFPKKSEKKKILKKKIMRFHTLQKQFISSLNITTAFQPVEFFAMPRHGQGHSCMAFCDFKELIPHRSLRLMHWLFDVPMK